MGMYNIHNLYNLALSLPLRFVTGIQPEFTVNQWNPPDSLAFHLNPPVRIIAPLYILCQGPQRKPLTARQGAEGERVGIALYFRRK